MYSKIAFRNVKKSFKDFTVYFITLLLGVCIFYAFNSISSQANSLDMNDLQKAMMTLLGMSMKGISFVVAIILGFLIIYANRYLIKRRKAEFAIYLTLGMERSKVSLIIVIETLLVGLLSLICGIVLGVIVSQGMLFITAGMFSMDITSFNMVFSGDACIATIIYFAIIFLVALIFNVATISRYKLINLINATKQNEKVVLRNMTVAIILFVVAVACIAIAYWQLIATGTESAGSNNSLTIAAVLILVGTVLFFYSSGTFLLRAFQSRKKLYYKGVNMFVLRQISSRINTAFVSVSVVCIALFLAIVCVSLGFGLSSSLNKALEVSTKYDASLSFDVELSAEEKELLSAFGVDTTNTEAVSAAAADGFDVLTGLERAVPDAAIMIESSAQISYYQAGLTYADMAKAADAGGKTYYEDMGDYPLSIVKASDFNALRELNGQDAVDLQPGQCLFWADVAQGQDAFEKFGTGKSITVGGKTLTFIKDALYTDSSQTSVSPSNTGTVVIADSDLPANATLMKTVLNVYLRDDAEGAADGETMDNFSSTLTAAAGDNNPMSTWPIGSVTTAKQGRAMASGISAIIAYLAIYIGLVLMVACAAILALQQMTEALDSAHRYNMLSRIGAGARMLNGALLRQIGAYFFYPFVLAVAHACLMCWALKDIFSAFGMTDLVSTVGSTIGIVFGIYVVYFLITYLAARAIVFTRSR